MRYFLNTIMCGWNFFPSIIYKKKSAFTRLELNKNEIDISKCITNIRKKKYKTLITYKKNVIL